MKQIAPHLDKEECKRIKCILFGENKTSIWVFSLSFYLFFLSGGIYEEFFLAFENFYLLNPSKMSFLVF